MCLPFAKSFTFRDLAFARYASLPLLIPGIHSRECVDLLLSSGNREWFRAKKEVLSQHGPLLEVSDRSDGDGGRVEWKEDSLAHLVCE